MKYEEDPHEGRGVILWSLTFLLIAGIVVVTFWQPSVKPTLALENKRTSFAERRQVTEKIKEVEKPLGIAGIIEKESRAAGIDPLITLAIIHQESGPSLRTDRVKREKHLVKKFKTEAWMNPVEVELQASSMGLMQVIPGYHLKTCGLSSFVDLFDPQKNIRCGLTVLKNCAKQFTGSSKSARLKHALKCYNGSSAYAQEVFQRIAELTVEKIG